MHPPQFSFGQQQLRILWHKQVFYSTTTGVDYVLCDNKIIGEYYKKNAVVQRYPVNPTFYLFHVAILVTYFGFFYCSNPAVGLQRHNNRAGLGKLLVIELFYLPRGWVSYWSRYFISIVTPLFSLCFYVALLVTIFGTLCSNPAAGSQQHKGRDILSILLFTSLSCCDPRVIFRYSLVSLSFNLL